MLKYLFGLILLIKGFVGESQTFLKPAGSIIGGQTVMNIPTTFGFYPNGQILIYYPSDYFTNPKKHPLKIFLGGNGEENSLDIGQMLNTSLPYLISKGLRPYNIDPVTKDTITWLVVSIHDNAGQVYTYPQLQYIIPWILDKAGLNIDTTCVWGAGLSGGGSATWSIVMGNKVGDTSLGKRMTGIMPMANGGYDDYMLRTSANAVALFKSGLACLYIIGDQDPGYNKIGYFAYDSLARKYAQPGRYITRVVIGGTHSTNVWNIPYPLENKVWPNINMNTWELMWSLRKQPVVVPPTVIIPPVVIPPIVKDTLYPVRIVMKMNDSSCRIIYSKP